jgi:hypothetical protein
MNLGVGIGLFVGGYVACWFTRDWLTSVFVGAETQIRAFEDKIKALKAKL